MNDFFHKRGTTLILCFQRGEEEYDEEALLEKKTHVAYFDGHEDAEEFCRKMISEYNPGRIYVETNTKIPDLQEKFPEIMKVTSTVTLFDWDTFDLHYQCFRQEISQMVSASQQITFRDCPSKELLAPYSQEFRLMNPKASYLRQDPLGFHEKAFDLFVPYSLDDDMITISQDEYLVFWLDAADHPEHYENKQLHITAPLELRESSGVWSAGRVVMTCCMADLQFMSFELEGSQTGSLKGGWITAEAVGAAGADEYGRRVLKLDLRCFSPASPPETGVILQAGRR